MQKKLYFLIITFFFISVNMLAVSVYGATGFDVFKGYKIQKSPELVWIILDKTALEDIIFTRTKNIDKLQQKGAFGLINVRTAGNLRSRSTYLSVGAGNRCQGSKKSHSGKNKGKSVFNPDIEDLKMLNKKNTYQSQIGLIGDMCEENKLILSVLGNTDSNIAEKRTIVSMVMNSKGYIPLGDVSKSLFLNTDSPWGYRTNWEEMKKKFLEYSQKADVIVIETGDMSRIEEYSASIDQEKLLMYKQETLERIDGFIGYIINHLDLNKTQIGIIVPTPPLQAKEKGRKLSWVLFAGRNIEQGWLTSLTTRRTGILTISDLAPAFFKGVNITLNNTNLSGTPFRVKKAEVSWKKLLQLNNKISIISNLRSPFIKSFIALQLVVVFIAILRMIKNKVSKNVIIQKFFEYLLLALLLAPTNFLLISILVFSNPWFYVLLLLILTIIEIYVLKNLFPIKLSRVVVITLTLVVIIAFDLVNNYKLMGDSLLGYSSIIGARFYGLGNEYMGLFVGGVLIGVMGLIEIIDKYRAKSIVKSGSFVILFVIATYFIGSAGLGANFGGLVTMAVSGIFTWIYFKKNSLHFFKMFGMIIFTITIIVVIVYLDYKQISGPRSHIGRIVKPLLTGNFQVLKQVIYRKLAMNLKLLKWTIWTRVLLAFLVYLIVIFKYPVGKLKKLFNKYSYLAAGFYGSISGAIITIFVNDSGVVAAATILFFPMLTLLYLICNLTGVESKGTRMSLT